MIKKHKQNGYLKIINKKTGKLKLVKYYKNGLLNGKIIYYWDNGEIRLTGQYKNMKRIGIWQTYNSSGELILEENFNKERTLTNKQLVLLPIQSLIKDISI